jgi:hypothetical protein
MHIGGAKDLSGLVDLRVGVQSFLDQATHPFFVIGMPFDRFDNQAMGGSSGLPG